MPRKTKKKKKLARLHRTFAKSKAPLSAASESFEEKSTAGKTPADKYSLYSYEEEDPATQVSKPKKEVSEVDYSYVFKDFKKISVFTILAFFFQVMLYFILNRG